MIKTLDINVIITSQDNEDIGGDVDLQLLNVRDQMGEEAFKDFVSGLKEAVVQFVAQYGDVDEF